MGSAGSIRRGEPKLSAKELSHHVSGKADRIDVEVQDVGPHQVNLVEVGNEPSAIHRGFTSDSQRSDQDEVGGCEMRTSCNDASAPFPPELDEEEVRALNSLEQFQSWTSDPASEEDVPTCDSPPALPAMRRQHREQVEKLNEYLDAMVAAQACMSMEDLPREEQLLTISPKFLLSKS
eukprot:TRINITY_DN100935_c0_g1_i1.p1 TRINITY_DN100935_c0_g1~~TRINITY_DN100935_c0_g1_i1.p1  ORF type:complete len:178 (+),score=31.04 TRINITY_DN100935_c0_g1_i1:71-604(+)